MDMISECFTLISYSFIYARTRARAALRVGKDVLIDST